MISFKLRLFAFSALTLFSFSCGRDQNQGIAEDSEVSSLTDLPCRGYNYPVGDFRYQCTRLMAGGREVEVLWQLKGQFTEGMANKLKQAIVLAADRFSAHWKSPTFPSPLMSCIERNTNNSWDPLNSILSTTFPVGERKITWSLTTLSLGFSYHYDMKSPIVINSYDVALDANGATSAARAYLGNDKLPVTTRMDFEVNRVALAQPDSSTYDYSINGYAGFVIHELLHTRGYEHPDVGRSQGPLVYEVGNCFSDLNTGLFGLTSSSKPLPSL